MIATLPHHPTELNDIVESIEDLKRIIASCTQHFKSPPEVICIARSDGDGYTDPDLVRRK